MDTKNSVQSYHYGYINIGQCHTYFQIVTLLFPSSILLALPVHLRFISVSLALVFNVLEQLPFSCFLYV